MPEPTEKLRVTKIVGNIANLSANQLRERLDSNLSSFVQTSIAQQQAAVSEGIVPVLPRIPTTVFSEPLSFSPNAFSQQVSGSSGGGDTPVPPPEVPNVGDPKQIIIVDNGTANYYTIPATFVGVVP